MNGGSFKQLLEKDIPGFSLEKLNQELSGDEWAAGSFMLQYLQQLGAYDFNVAEWRRTAMADGTELTIPGPSKVAVRELRMQSSVPPHPMCPKTTRVTTTLCLLEAETSQGCSPSI